VESYASRLSGEEVAVGGSHPHRVNRETTSVVHLEHDQLEQIAAPVRPEKERPTGLTVRLLERVTGERVLRGVGDVLARDAVLAS
jgi:hypothetical protein